MSGGASLRFFHGQCQRLNPFLKFCVIGVGPISQHSLQIRRVISTRVINTVAIFTPLLRLWRSALRYESTTA